MPLPAFPGPTTPGRRAALALVAFLVGSSLAAAAPRKLAAADLDALELLAGALRQADAASVPSVATGGLADVDLGLSEGCRAALRAITGARGDVRAMAALQATQSCKVACIDELG